MKRFLALLLCLLLLPFTVLAESITPDEDETGAKPWDDEVIEKVLVSIEVTPPTKTEYYVGDSINLSGMKVMATYDDESTADVTALSSVDADTFDTAGTVTVTVSYEGMTDTFEVEVIAVALESIEVTAPTKTSYFVGDTLDTAGMTVKAIYNNGDEEVVTADASVDTTTLTTAGTATVTVTYEDKTATFTVDVALVVVEKIEVTAPTKTSYYEGDTLDTAGMTVVATYNNGSTKDVTADASVDTTTLTTAGTATVTVTYDGKTNTFTVEVTALVVESIAVTPPTKVEYKVGEALDTAGMTVIATYNNGSTADVTASATASPTTFETEGSATVTVTFEGKTATFDVTVKKAYMPGDINGDGNLSSTDVTMLRRYIAGGYGLEDKVVLDAVDVNKDGKLSSTDVTILRRYIAGGYGIELK